MKGHTNNIKSDDNHSHQPKRSSRNCSHALEVSATSLKSKFCESDTKLCVFERDGSGYGFKITGNAPVKVQAVRQDGVAWLSGLRENDVILKVNDVPVIDKQHKDVVALIRKDNRVELLVESDSSQTISTATNSSSKIKPLSQSTYIPKYEQNVTRLNSHSTKVQNKLKPISGSLLQRPVNHQTVQRNTTTPSQIKYKSEKIDDGPKTDCTDTSEYSISTSTDESDPPRKLPSKIKPAVVQSPRDSYIGTPIKSNSYNVPSNISVTKEETHINKGITEKMKNKTIPPDRAKSYCPAADGSNVLNTNQQSIYSTLPKKIDSGLILGLDFDDHNMEEDGSDSCPSLIEMLSSTKEALSKPSLVAILLSFVKEKFEDMKIMIFYYTCKLYKTMALRQEFVADAQRMATEIITTFLLEKSPLYLCVNIDIITKTKINFKVGENFDTIFDPILEIIYEVLKDIVDDVRGKMKRGIQLSEDVSSFVNSISPSMNHDREMILLHRAMCNIFQRSQKDSNVSDSVLATHIGLATMYQYFYKSCLLPGSSIRARSTECINNLISQNKVQSISDFFKVHTLCAPYQQKLSVGLRKKNKTVNGHVLCDVACQEPKDCAVCDGLLWGTSPQGFICSICKSFYHVLCKKKIKNPCLRKLRKSNSQLNNKEEKSAYFGRLSRKSSTNSVRTVSFSASRDTINTVGNNYFNVGTLLPADKTSPLPFEVNSEMFKSQSEMQLNRNNTCVSHFERFGSGYDISGSIINSSLDNGSTGNDQVSVQVNELVQDESFNDPDMRMEESFDAEAEINLVFPNVDPEMDKQRLIVLLEFYHKTRYILMNLKRFLYILVKKWPSSQEVYFKALSLDCISPFVDLIKSLVLTIEKCITEQDFVGLEQAVLDWLSDNNDYRLKEWISLSSNLCCTNSLNSVKQLKQTTLRTIPELTNLLKAKFHKLIIIEELTQIRPLLISLPLIVKNVIKCLMKQESLYSEELVVWKQISVKMDYLCEYIDRCCIPLVDWINNGSICRRTEKVDFQNKFKDSEKEIKDFCVDFPRTLFHFPIFDFQMAKIMTWCTNTKKIGLEIQTAYFKKGTEVLLIFYKTFIAVLQKDNDHYILKPIKPLKNVFERQSPIIEISNGIIVKNGGLEENHFILNVISHKPDNALLLRIGFSRLEVVESWLEFITTKSFSLSRSISLFKSFDIGSAFEGTHHFDRSASNASGKSKISQDSADVTSMANSYPEISEKGPEASNSYYTSLSETLTKATDILDSKTPLCAILNTSEDDLSKRMEMIKENGVQSLEELTAIFYTLSQTMIQNTSIILEKSFSNVSNSSNIDIDPIKEMLTTTVTILETWEKNREMKESSKCNLEVKSRSLSPTAEVQSSDLAVDLTRRSREGSADFVIDEIKYIIEEIIEEAIKRLQISGEELLLDKRAYSDVVTPSTDGSNHLSAMMITPQCSPLISPNEKSVTFSKAKIVLSSRSCSQSSG